MTTNLDGVEFAEWLEDANRICVAIAGVGIDDLADGPSYDAWSDGVEPAEYVEERLVEAGFPAELL